MTHRLTYIDTTRAILITLVVLEHVLNYANPQYNIIPYTLAQEWIGAFHMPAFFVLSGLLTDGEKWRGRSAGAYFVRKARTLLVPYLFFECIAILYKHFVLRSVSLLEGLRLMATVRCNVGADWFLPAMFLACALYYLYIRFPHRAAWGIGGAALLLGLPFMMSTRGGHLQVLLFRGALGFVFMLAGNLLKKQLMAFSWPKIGGAFFLTAAAAAVCFKFSLGNSFYDGVLRSPLLYLVSGVCGTYFVLGLADRIPWKWAQPDRRKRPDRHGYAPARAVPHPRKQQPPLGNWRFPPDRRSGSGADPHHQPRLPCARGQTEKGTNPCLNRPNGRRSWISCGWPQCWP